MSAGLVENVKGKGKLNACWRVFTTEDGSQDKGKHNSNDAVSWRVFTTEDRS